MLIKSRFNLLRQKTNRRRTERRHMAGRAGGGVLKNTNGQWNGNR